jgi:hypothetical protein
MKTIIRIENITLDEIKVLKEAFKSEGLRVIKGWNTLIIPIEGGLKKENNSYKNWLKAKALVQRLGYQNCLKTVRL